MNRKLFAALLFCSFIVLSSCQQHQTARINDPQPATQQPTTPTTAPAQTVAPAVKPTNILVNIKNGMTPEEVVNIIGNPQDRNIYETGKRWIPFYFGPDTRRSDWFYGNYGQITFSINKYNGQLRVINVLMK